jgi:hypothetical protein
MADDLRSYTQELFKKAGVDNEKAKAILEALGDESIQKAFKSGFVEGPQHHSTLDRMKSEWQNKLSEYESKIRQYDDWYQKQALPAYQQYQSAAQALQRYQELYGPIESAADARQAAAATGLTKEQVTELVNETLKQRDQAYVNLTKDVTWATTDHLQRFKEPLDLDAVEQYALKNGVSFRQAYKEVIAPKLEEQRNAEWEAKLKAAREEGYKDAISKARIPVDSKPREPHPIFDRKDDPSQPLSDIQQERISREAFFDEWNKYALEKAS